MDDLGRGAGGAKAHPRGDSMSLYDELQAAAEAVRAKLPGQPKVGLILGSGLGSFADTLANPVKIPYDKIPGFHASTVVGHAGNLVYGTSGSSEVLAMQGRIHFYEGHDIARVVFPVRTLVMLGCKTLIITNAAGGV